MTSVTPGTITDEDMETVWRRAATAGPRDADGTDTGDGDATDATDGDGTDSGDSDGTDGGDADGTDA